MESAAVDPPYPPLVQPKPWVRWAAVLLAIVGWYLSFQSFRVSAGAEVNDPLLRAVCGGSADGTDNCTSVLTSPEAYLGPSNGPRIPVSTLGMGYFAFLGLWYVFIGPPTANRRLWHFVVAAVVFCGVLQSLYYIAIMAYDLHRWCGSCLATHAVNGGFLLVTLLAWPWRRRRRATPTRPHPSARLVLATMTAGGLAFLAHLAIVYVFVAGSILSQRTAQYAKILDDPEFLQWNYARQPAVSIPLREDEAFAGSPTAPNTVVVFSDFYCTHCRESHETLQHVARKYPGALRIAFRYYPQDPECNPNPRFRVGGHAAACRTCRAAEAARVIGGRDAYLHMRERLWGGQAELPTVSFAMQSEAQRRILDEWAVETGLDGAAFTQAMESPEVAARLAADIALADELGISAVPALYLNGKRVLNWTKLGTWDALLDGASAATTQPAAAP